MACTACTLFQRKLDLGRILVTSLANGEWRVTETFAQNFDSQCTAFSMFVELKSMQ